MYCLHRIEDGKFVARPGSQYSYTKFQRNAQMFKTKEEAEQNRCPDNERIVEVANAYY